MNYLKQIHGFCLRRRLEPLSASAIALYYVLLEIFNSVGFPDELSLPLGRLSAECSLGKTALYRARDELAARGYISVRKSVTSARSAVYAICAIEASEIYGGEGI